MKLNIGPYELSISRRADTRSALAMSREDLREINDAYLEYLRARGDGWHRERLTRHVHSVATPVPVLAEHLRKTGLVVLDDLLPTSLLDTVSFATEQLLTEVRELATRLQEPVETPRYLLQGAVQRLSGFKTMESHHTGVVSIRQGQDQGMMDIFGWHKIPEGGGAALLEAISTSPLHAIVEAACPGVRFTGMNLYCNEGITTTRGFHVDSFSSRLKAFIYLTDVLSLDFGPYTFVPDTHEASAFRDINRLCAPHLWGHRETPLLNPARILPVLAARGSVIISNQAGFHRGFPQQPGARRLVAVVNYH
ncbi:phytanoyl-CoA dioxygenase family protein [Perlucidibaca piscinae]|uniref:hypothetical protein n=1 Tax=Perlucidibaca piscinae TaxID=392589 RepID=UPI0003B5FD3F|nr:hypothetical protein [Perlucidibaca piscinae]